MSKSLKFYMQKDGAGVTRVIDRRLSGTARGLGYLAALDATGRSIKDAPKRKDRNSEERQGNK